MSLSTYPSAQGADGQFAVAYGYDNGQVANISDVVTGQQYWTLLESDQGYRLRRERFGNGAETLRTYKALSGRPDLITTSVPINGTPTVIQGISHAYDARSNLVSRTDTVVPTLSRSYQYDELDRLHIVSGSSGQLDSIDYDAIGNIMARSTVGQYV